MAVRLQSALFDAGAELMRITGGRTDAGAAVTFLGQMRDLNLGKEVITMELEHYPALAQKQLERIEKEACSRWPLLECLIVHRFGLIKPAEPIVLVITLSTHREAAFAGAEFIMDFLKTEAPFWKSEQSPDGQKKWVQSRNADEAAKARW